MLYYAVVFLVIALIAAESEHGGDQCDDQEHDCVIQHVEAPLWLSSLHRRAARCDGRRHSRADGSQENSDDAQADCPQSAGVFVGRDAGMPASTVAVARSGMSIVVHYCAA